MLLFSLLERLRLFNQLSRLCFACNHRCSGFLSSLQILWCINTFFDSLISFIKRSAAESRSHRRSWVNRRWGWWRRDCWAVRRLVLFVCHWFCPHKVIYGSGCGTSVCFVDSHKSRHLADNAESATGLTGVASLKHIPLVQKVSRCMG